MRNTKELRIRFTAFGLTGSKMSMFEPIPAIKVKPGRKCKDKLDVIA